MESKSSLFFPSSAQLNRPLLVQEEKDPLERAKEIQSIKEEKRKASLIREDKDRNGARRDRWKDAGEQKEKGIIRVGSWLSVHFRNKIVYKKLNLLNCRDFQN